jgi:hypothetical protein
VEKHEKQEKPEKPENHQKGGGEIEGIAEWVAAVKQTPAFKNSESDVRLSDLKDESLTLPERQKDDVRGLFIDEPAFSFNEPDFLINGSDIRDVAATLRELFDSTVNDNPTTKEFKEHVSSIQTDPNIDPSVLSSILLAEEVEAYLQKEANPEKQVDLQKVLTDPQYSPLFFLTLLANTTPREGKDEVPLLVPTPAQQAE